ncbi:MAG TPA: N-acetylmuramoyl-L-alanine amidase [Candidatus Angelobacter sp.]|nr:N-acetylmuramoyl-L-alanine amidase [Candidatus Angelobacter sp.]
MLLNVGNIARFRIVSLSALATALFAGAALLFAFQAPSPSQQPATQSPATQSATPPTAVPIPTAQPQQGTLNVVVLDPAHGGTDTGARGTGGIRESEIILDLASEVRRALESQGFQVVQTRQSNDNPSFDDRSAIANAQRGAVFVTLHIASTGLPGTVRAYVNSDLPPLADSNGLIPWDRAQAPYLGLSRKFADLVQAALAQRFKGSPDTSQTASIRQLRTTAAPAIAVEISSVVVNDRAELDRMAPGVAEAIARGAASFKPLYVVPAIAGAQP